MTGMEGCVTERRDEKGRISVDVSENSGSVPGVLNHSNYGPSLVERQTRTRRLFSFAQLVAFELVYMGTWSATAGNMYYALLNGGPAAWFWGFIIVSFGALLQAAAFSEMASIMPIAGAQYYWTWHFAPVSMRRFLTWIQGWTTWAGYVAMVASCVSSNATSIEAVVQLYHVDFDLGGWHTTVLMLAIIALCAAVNIWAFRAVPWFEFMSGILNVSLFVVTVVVLLVMSPRNSTNIFYEASSTSGWNNYFLSANIGALSNVWLYVAFESVVHMGEETRNARTTVPKATFWTMVGSIAMGAVMMIILMFVIPSTELLIDSSYPIITLLMTNTGSRAATTAIAVANMILSVSTTMGTVSSVSRISWAWARDGGLPQYFGYVDAKYRVPARAVVLVAVLCVVLSLFNLGSGTYVALSAITSLSCMAVYLSYVIVLACVLHFRLTKGFPATQWSLGRLGTAVNIAALVYTVYMIIWLPFPNYLPVTADNMNYSGPVLLIVLIGAVSLWVVQARNHWAGPNQAVIDFVLNSEDEK